MVQGKIYKNNNDRYSTFSEGFKSVLDRHASLKRKMIRGRQGLFMNKQPNKPILTRPKLKNRCLGWPSRENLLDYKRAKNTCNILNKFKKALL